MPLSAEGKISGDGCTSHRVKAMEGILQGRVANISVDLCCGEKVREKKKKKTKHLNPKPNSILGIATAASPEAFDGRGSPRRARALPVVSTCVFFGDAMVPNIE